MPNTVYYGTSKAIYADGTVRSNRIYTRLYKKIKYEVFNGRMPNHQAIVAHKNVFKIIILIRHMNWEQILSGLLYALKEK